MMSPEAPAPQQLVGHEQACDTIVSMEYIEKLDQIVLYCILKMPC